MKPPVKIDGARVIEWAWSDQPFGTVEGSELPAVDPIAIHGLAIGEYPGHGGVYRFSCDRNWETVQDKIYSSVEEAKEQLPTQYQAVPAIWITTASNLR